MCSWEGRGHAHPGGATLRDPGSPGAVAALSPRSLVWLPGMARSSVFSGDCGSAWARVARSALRYCNRVTWGAGSIAIRAGGQAK